MTDFSDTQSIRSVATITPQTAAAASAYSSRSRDKPNQSRSSSAQRTPTRSSASTVRVAEGAFDISHSRPDVVISVVGPKGSGKTALIRALVSQYPSLPGATGRQSSGTVYFEVTKTSVIDPGILFLFCPSGLEISNIEFIPVTTSEMPNSILHLRIVEIPESQVGFGDGNFNLPSVFTFATVFMRLS